MAHAKLHIICGNCGSNEFLSFTIVRDFNDFGDYQTDGVVIHCGNCSTNHSLDDTIEDKGVEE